jgi:hypothetical protein
MPAKLHELATMLPDLTARFQKQHPSCSPNQIPAYVEAFVPGPAALPWAA